MVSMGRVEIAREVLSADRGDGFVAHENDGAVFAGRFPGGFAPLGRIAEGDFLEFSASHVALIGEGLSEPQFRRLCEAICVYQRATAINFCLLLPPDLIVLAFISEHPDDAAVLAAVAARLRMSLVRFVGADRGTGIHT